MIEPADVERYGRHVDLTIPAFDEESVRAYAACLVQMDLTLFQIREKCKRDMAEKTRTSTRTELSIRMLKLVDDMQEIGATMRDLYPPFSERYVNGIDLTKSASLIRQMADKIGEES